MKKKQLLDWKDIKETIGQTGPESGKIMYDVENSKGSRITIESETEIAPYAVTLGVYGLMFHTDYFSTETESKAFAFQAMKKIEDLFQHLDIPEDQQDENWKKVYNELIDKIAE